MPRTFLQILAFAGTAVAVSGGGGQPAAAAPRKPLVFEGTVLSIGQIADDFRPWLVTVTVDKVVAGNFSEPTLSFAVHSPAMSGLEVGRSYTVRAVWKGRGYDVDPLQWRRPKRVRVDRINGAG